MSVLNNFIKAAKALIKPVSIGLGMVAMVGAGLNASAQTTKPGQKAKIDPTPKVERKVLQNQTTPIFRKNADGSVTKGYTKIYEADEHSNGSSVGVHKAHGPLMPNAKWREYVKKHPDWKKKLHISGGHSSSYRGHELIKETVIETVIPAKPATPVPVPTPLPPVIKHDTIPQICVADTIKASEEQWRVSGGVYRYNQTNKNFDSNEGYYAEIKTPAVGPKVFGHRIVKGHVRYESGKGQTKDLTALCPNGCVIKYFGNQRDLTQRLEVALELGVTKDIGKSGLNIGVSAYAGGEYFTRKPNLDMTQKGTYTAAANPEKVKWTPDQLATVNRGNFVAGARAVLTYDFNHGYKTKKVGENTYQQVKKNGLFVEAIGNAYFSTAKDALANPYDKSYVYQERGSKPKASVSLGVGYRF